MLRDLTFCDEKFSFRLERLSMLFSLTTGAKNIATKVEGQGMGCEPSPNSPLTRPARAGRR
jgi:hypothetical protein